MRSTLNGALAAHPLFEAVFANVARFDDALYLVPEPDEPFRSLIVAICRAFPDMPPYGEPSYRPEDVVPHLTVAIGNGTGFDDLAAETEPCLPFSRRVSSVAVVTERPGGTWKTRWRLSLTAVRP